MSLCICIYIYICIYTVAQVFPSKWCQPRTFRKRCVRRPRCFQTSSPTSNTPLFDLNIAVCYSVLQCVAENTTKRVLHAHTHARKHRHTHTDRTHTSLISNERTHTQVHLPNAVTRTRNFTSIYHQIARVYNCLKTRDITRQYTSQIISCNKLQHTATHQNARQHTATHSDAVQHSATHCNTLQHTDTATHCGTLQRTATHGNTRQHTATNCNKLQHTATHCNTATHWNTHTRQHTATHCNTLKHTKTH